MLYFSHVEIHVPPNDGLHSIAASPLEGHEEACSHEREAEAITSVRKRKRQIGKPKSKKVVHNQNLAECEQLHHDDLHNSVRLEPNDHHEVNLSHDTQPETSLSRSLEQTNLSLEGDLIKAKKDLEELRTLHQNGAIISLARMNANNDLQTKLQNQKEIEKILRTELEDTHSEHLERQARDERIIDNLRSVEQKMRKELFDCAESTKELNSKLIGLEEDVRKTSDDLASAKIQAQTQSREAKRKEEYVSELHRDIDRQGAEARSVEKRLQQVIKEAEARRARVTELENRQHKQERDFAAKLVKSHADAEDKYRSRENELLRRIYTLEASSNENRDKQSTTLGLLNILAQNGKANAQKVGDDQSKIMNLTTERDALRHSQDDLKKKYETVKASLAKAQSSRGHSDAYLKLLKINELLQKENQVLKNKVQDLSSGIRGDGVPTDKAAVLEMTSERQSSELDASCQPVEQERSTTDHM